MGGWESSHRWLASRFNQLHIKQQSVLDVDPPVARKILDDVASTNGVNFDADRLHGQQSTGEITYTYDWTIEAVPEGSLIQEDVYVDPIKHYAEAAIFTGGGLLFLAAAGHVSLVIVFPLAIIWLYYHKYLSSSEGGVIQDLIEKSVGFDRIEVHGVLSSLILISAIGGVIGFVIGASFVVSFAGLTIVVLGLVYGVANQWYASIIMKIDYQRFLPTPTIEYLSLLLLQITPLGIALLLYQFIFHFDQTLLAPRFPFTELPYRETILKIGLVYCAIRSLVVLHHIKKSVNRLDVNYRLFKQGVGKVKHSVIQGISLGIALVPGITSFVLVWLYLRKYGRHFQHESSFQILIGMVILPIGLHAIGLLSQSTISSIKVSKQLWKSVSPEFDLPNFIQANVRVVNRSDAYAASFSLGVTSYIIVSQRLVDDLQKRELYAILAHEQGHLHYNDGIIGFITPYLATVLLIGRNVVFGALDFRAREFRADAFAVQQTTVGTYINALQKSKTIQQQHSWHGLGPGLSSVVDASPAAKDWLRRYLSLFYGTYAMSEAHPTLDQRIQRIRRDS